MLVPALPPPFPLAWGFSTKADDPALLPERRLIQVHGTRIVEACLEVQEADGQWTTKPGLRIGVRTADCVPVLLAGGPVASPGWRPSTPDGEAPSGVAAPEMNPASCAPASRYSWRRAAIPRP